MGKTMRLRHAGRRPVRKAMTPEVAAKLNALREDRALALRQVRCAIDACSLYETVSLHISGEADGQPYSLTVPEYPADEAKLVQMVIASWNLNNPNGVKSFHIGIPKATIERLTLEPVNLIH